MPQVISLVGLLATAAQAGITALGAPGGPLTVDSITGTRRHIWPPAAKTRGGLFDAAFRDLDCFPQMRHLRTVIEAAARRPQAELDSEAAGKPSPSYGTEYPIQGNCISRVVGDDAAALILDPTATIEPGDVVMFAARGTPAAMGKVFAGRHGGELWFWASEPQTFITIDAANVLHVEKAVAVKDRAGRQWPLDHRVSFPILKCFDAFTPPRMASLELAFGMVLADIAEIARTLPDEPAHRPMFWAA